MNISVKTIDRAAEQIKGILHTYRAEIDEAFVKSEGGLTISLGLKFEPSEGKIKITTPIKFVSDQIKDSFETVYDEAQEELFRGIANGDITISTGE